WNFEYLRPPRDTFFDRGQGWTSAHLIRFSEHHVVRPLLRDDHRVVPAHEPARAGNAFRLELADRVRARDDSAQMRPIRSNACDKVKASLDQKCASLALHRERD